jgi:hypothetical protein
VGELYSQLLAHETGLVLVGKHSPPQTMPCMDMAVLQEVMVEAIPVVEAILATVDYVNKPRNHFSPCQLSGRTNHPIFECYTRFDLNYMGEEKSANTANSYGVDSNWYAALGATDHVTR